MIPEREVGCKICEKSIYRIFVEHIQEHLDSGIVKAKATLTLIKEKKPE